MSERASLSVLLFFTRQFSSMVKSHLRLWEVLDTLARDDSTHRVMRRVLSRLAEAVEQGEELDEAMKRFPRVFDSGYISLIRSGTQTARLSDALESITTDLERQYDIRSKVRAAISYPVFILVIFVVVFNIMVLFVLPKFAAIYARSGQELPPLTQVVIDVGEMYKTYWYLIVASILALFVVPLFATVSTRVRLWWDRFKLKIWLFGGMSRMSAMSRFLRTLAVLVRNGIGLTDAILLAGEASRNLYLQGISQVITKDLEGGSNMYDAFRRHQEMFQNIVLQMIRAAEEAGRMADPLLSTADHFDHILANRTHIITNLITPIFTILLGGVIAGMLVAAFLPIFSMARNF